MNPHEQLATSAALDSSPPCSGPGSNMSVSRVTARNALLDALPAELMDKWRVHFELVDLPLGKVLFEAGDKQGAVYFPTSGIVSLLLSLENGACAEVAMAGREGLVGIPLLMGGHSTLTRAVVQSAGQAIKLKGSVVMAEFEKNADVTHLLLLYAMALITQMSQTAVCNRHHSLSQQLCRWLLMSLDRIDGNQLVMTHELIANMLGVRREGVTDAAKFLKRDGLIDYQRGVVVVLDRPRLVARCCECYSVVKREYDRLLPASLAS